VSGKIEKCADVFKRAGGGQKNMNLGKIHSFLVHPAKGEEIQPLIGGTEVPQEGRLGDMLAAIFARAPLECDIAITFRPNDDGNQENECRDDLVTYIGAPTIATGRTIAGRLQRVTTHRSGLGLLFLMTGADGAVRRLVASRFPADQGILAEENKQQLSVEFLERVFMKSTKAYKSAVFESDSAQAGFWDGRAIDRQISSPRELSDYWIRDFLLSELRTTGAAGTKRLAVAFRSAINQASALDTRQELIAAATLLSKRDGETASANQLIDQLGLSSSASEAVESQLPRPDLLEEVFRFDTEEFERHLLYRLVELDNGGLLIAENDAFPRVFERIELAGSDGLVAFRTQGHVVDERLRKAK